VQSLCEGEALRKGMHYAVLVSRLSPLSIPLKEVEAAKLAPIARVQRAVVSQSGHLEVVN